MSRLALVLSAFVIASALVCAAEDAYTPLTLYNGGWRIQKAGTAAPDNLVNHCALTGLFYSCEQVVNGKTVALVIFVPADAPGKYHTQAVLPSGKAAGVSDLAIDGSHWVYLSSDVEGNKTTWYRTTNIFTGKDHIHFEQAQSADGIHWTVAGSGDEDRVPAP